MRTKPALPVATVATQTDTCSSEDGSYWDLFSVTSSVAIDDDDVDSVIGLSNVDEIAECGAELNQTTSCWTDISYSNKDNKRNARLQQLSSYRAGEQLLSVSDDDGYDVIVDDSSDDCSFDVIHDSFAGRQARRGAEFNNIVSGLTPNTVAQKKLCALPISTELQTASQVIGLLLQDGDRSKCSEPATPSDCKLFCNVATGISRRQPDLIHGWGTHGRGSGRTPASPATTDVTSSGPMSSCRPGVVTRSVPRMGTRLMATAPRLPPLTTCSCGAGGGGPSRRVVPVDGAAQRYTSQGAGKVGQTTSLSDSEGKNSSVALTSGVDVQFSRRAWSSDGDAPVAGVDSSSSSEGNSASELSPADACSAPTPRDVTCLPVTSNHGEKPQRSRSRLMSQRGDGGSTARRLAYEQFAHVMYTNRANLQHTIAVQQRLFQQQLSLPAAATTSTVRGYNVKGTPLQEIPPPLPPRPGSKKVAEEKAADGDGGHLDWVVRRRADGTRYITRRSRRHQDHFRHHQGHSRHPPSDQLTSSQLTSSTAQQNPAPLSTNQSARNAPDSDGNAPMVVTGAGKTTDLECCRRKETKNPVSQNTISYSDGKPAVVTGGGKKNPLFMTSQNAISSNVDGKPPLVAGAGNMMDLEGWKQKEPKNSTSQNTVSNSDGKPAAVTGGSKKNPLFTTSQNAISFNPDGKPPVVAVTGKKVDRRKDTTTVTQDAVPPLQSHQNKSVMALVHRNVPADRTTGFSQRQTHHRQPSAILAVVTI